LVKLVDPMAQLPVGQTWVVDRSTGQFWSKDGHVEV
jgi:hypothetical protein